MKKYLLSVILLAATLPLAAQFTQKVKGGNNQDAGVTYTLPKTALRITVDAQCTTTKAGPLAQFAEKYLGITDAPQENAEVWQVTGINVQPYALPDTAKTFHIVIPNAAQAPSFVLTDEGMLWGINCQPEKENLIAEVEEEKDEAKKQLHAINVMNEEMLRAGSKNKQAEIAARQIFRIRESRLNLLTGEVDNLPADGASFQLVLDNLEAQEKAYLELFMGVKSVTTSQRIFNYEPKDQMAEHILFRFSRHYGFVDVDDLVGEAYMLSINITENNTEVPVYTDAKGRVKPAATGIAFSIPGKIRYSVSLRGQELAYGNVLAAQFGHIERLSQNQFTDKKNPAKATFDLLTGNIRLYE